jgi:hypothetical protein
MNRASVSRKQRMVSRPTRTDRLAFGRAALTAFFLLACSKTPLEVLEAAGVGAGGQACEPAPAPLAGLYRLRSLSSQKCMGVGAMITVGGLPGRLTAMVDDCSKDAEVFQLIPDGAFGVFQLRASSGDNLDVEMVSMADGTRVIYFAANGFRNQRFSFEMRRERVFALIPENATSSCVSDVPPQPQIYVCKADLSNQEWELLPATCD